MEPQFELPAVLIQSASISGNEYGWPPALFPDVARRAESLGYACLGGQFQFRAPAGTCEMYWLSADSTDRQTTEDWLAYCARSRSEVLDRFCQIVDQTDFVHESMKWPMLKREAERGLDVLATLVFVASFVTEQEWIVDEAASKANPA
jgi:hypothetical protein